jgi:C1A family cysteine protease
MKFTIFASLAAVAAAQVDLDDMSIDMKTRFAAFKTQFGKTYTADEEAHAMRAFAMNDKKIATYNGLNLTYTLGHNEWSDMTQDEFNSKMLGGYVAKDESEKNYDLTLSDPARVAAAGDAKDWVALGAVTPIKNQGQCGSCWAFSTVMGIEGDLFVEKQKLISLSEQDLVSCDHNGDQGCNGGLMDNAFKWVEENGIATEEAYPYTSGGGDTGTCKKTTPAVKITGFTDVTPNDEAALLVAAAQQPVSVAIEADKSVFQLYKSGVLTSKACGTQLDHGVGIVGYGTLDSVDYWKVKNSWGATWGLDGYILMERNVNMCGISQAASYPTGATASGSAPAPSVKPSPSPPPPPAGKSHYEDPKNGCQSDEIAIQITGVAGDVCSPKCTGPFKTKCPTDVPAGVTAAPKCALQDTAGDHYCILECTPASNDACGPNASCKAIQGVGLCTYDDR